MAKITFDEIWEAAKSLTPEEQRRLRELLHTLLLKEGAPLTKEDEVDLALLKEGLLSEIPPPLSEAEIKRLQNWRPIEIQGEPLSETIIKERR